MPELMSSLPIAGRDGTARRRLANSPAPARPTSRPAPSTACAASPATCWPSGQRYAVVLMINHPNAGARAQDALLEWVAGQ
jgi:D-alanyl-D-alanine carboxypeptidase/D-alanyl-D-alanine-endopeptidase (penicillin-binding protein 4)